MAGFVQPPGQSPPATVERRFAGAPDHIRCQKESGRVPGTLMHSYPKSSEILKNNSQFILGGIASTNRAVEPAIVFVRGQGAHIWDAEGRSYLDYHAAFAPHLLGHNRPAVTEAVVRALRE